MTNLPPAYSWLGKLGTLPLMVQEAIKLHGTVETPGAKNCPTIMGWADEVGVPALGYKYTADSVPWCGLFMAVVAKRAHKSLPYGPLYALNWAVFGSEAGQPVLGDVLTFVRTGGGHVGLYIAEDKTRFYVLGGNQGDRVSFSAIEKKRLYRARRPAHQVMAASAKPYVLASNGQPASENEA